jgi:hypothetical protein
MSKGFHGTLEECVQHFVAANKFDSADRAMYIKRNRVCDLIGISYPTGLQWFSKMRLPIGENALRLRVFLQLLGYTVIDRRPQTPSLQELSLVVAFACIPIQDIADYIGGAYDVVLEMALGRQGISSQREEKLQVLLAGYKTEVERKKKEWLSVINELHLVGVAQESVTVAPTLPAKSSGHVNSSDPVEMLAHLLMVIKPLAERVASDECSPDDRKRLRELVRNGRSNLVFDLSNIFTRLCGERARNELATSQNHKEPTS